MTVLFTPAPLWVSGFNYDPHFWVVPGGLPSVRLGADLQRAEIVARGDEDEVGLADEFGGAEGAGAMEIGKVGDEDGRVPGCEVSEAAHDLARGSGAVDVGAVEGVIEAIHDDEGGAALVGEDGELDGAGGFVEGAEVLPDDEVRVLPRGGHRRVVARDEDEASGGRDSVGEVEGEGGGAFLHGGAEEDEGSFGEKVVVRVLGGHISM